MQKIFSATKKICKIFVIAGETSGDILGEKIFTALPEVLPVFTVEGIGGPLMEKSGHFSSLFSFHSLSSMGVWHILYRIPHFIRLLGIVRKRLKENPPDLLLTIDSPQFSLRISKWLGQKMPHIPRIHCVSPAFWAWRPHRADKMHLYTDHVLALFSFETALYKTVPCTFVGHPVADYPIGVPENMWGQDHGHRNEPFLCVLPGSRPQEVSMSLPIFEKTVEILKKNIPHLQVGMVIPFFLTLPPSCIPCIKNVCKEDVFSAATAALSISGTVTLELAHQRTPMVIVYKVHRLTAWLVRKFSHVRYIGLVNIIAEKEIAPECLQEKFSPDILAQLLLPLLQKKAPWKAQRKDLKNLTPSLRGKKSFGKMCADVIAGYL